MIFDPKKGGVIFSTFLTPPPHPCYANDPQKGGVYNARACA